MALNISILKTESLTKIMAGINSKEKKRVLFLFVFVSSIYFVSYITRINFAAVVDSVVKTENVEKTAISIAITAGSVTYGLGQLLSGYLGDKFQPKTLMGLGFFATSAMNICIPFCKNVPQYVIVWAINGLAQAFMWPPLVKLMTFLFDSETYKRACVYTSWGSSFGTIVVYLIAPPIITFSSWKTVFFVCATVGILMGIYVLIRCPRTEITTKKKEAENNNYLPIKPVIPVLILLCIGIVLQGSLRDGVTTWMPSYISDTYHLGSAVAILTGVALPIFSILCYSLSSILYRKVFRNPMNCAGMIFTIGFVCSGLLILVNSHSAVCSVILTALFAGCMHGVNLILICMTPNFFREYGKVSLISGALNFSTYIGAAISNYGVAALAQNKGWRFTISTWPVIALAGAVICFASIKLWNKHFGKKKYKNI